MVISKVQKLDSMSGSLKRIEGWGGLSLEKYFGFEKNTLKIFKQ